MSAQPRKPAPRLARPAQRYWKGKAPKGAPDAESDSEEEDENEQQDADEDMPLGLVEEVEAKASAPSARKEKAAMNVALKDVNIDARGKVIIAGKEETGRTAMEEEEESEDEEDEEAKDDEEESGSSEEESESEEEEEPQKPMFRPVFVPKRGRVTVVEREAENPESEEAIARKERELEQRKKDSHDLVAESIKRELAEKAAEEVIPDVDDTDGLDPEAEFEAWRLRELSRIKRDKEAQLEREREKEEVERRRAMPEELRMQEDLEHAKKTRDDKPKGQQKFLQKYYHKGAFHQDADILKRRDYTEATESTVDVTLLPKVMQVKNFGKRSQTKYTHLLDQDTTRADNSGKGGNAYPVRTTFLHLGGNGVLEAVNLQMNAEKATADPGEIGTKALEEETCAEKTNTTAERTNETEISELIEMTVTMDGEVKVHVGNAGRATMTDMQGRTKGQDQDHGHHLDETAIATIDMLIMDQARITTAEDDGRGRALWNATITPRTSADGCSSPNAWPPCPLLLGFYIIIHGFHPYSMRVYLAGASFTTKTNMTASSESAWQVPVTTSRTTLMESEV
ncbi:hypothetical protein FRB99_003498 [Tulasnella sp. 403]|nr:hypothetical protein FRB99_003498 [Tulasnella sp. 403]